MERQRGFTLVELSIVLVILGLLVGGVLSGQSLIRAAELRSIVTERDQYLTAMHAFEDKYFSIPGDMPDAFRFWGTECGTDTITGSTGCNGNGDGLIRHNTLDGSTLIAENFKAWEHLSRAGLIAGSYNGIGVGSQGLNPTVENTPKAKFDSAAWDWHDGWEQNNAMGYSGGGTERGVLLSLGNMPGPTDDALGLYLLSTLTLGEAWNIDKKADDGRANTGSLRGDGSDSCYDNGTDAYRLQTNGADYIGGCILHFVMR